MLIFKEIIKLNELKCNFCAEKYQLGYNEAKKLQ